MAIFQQLSDADFRDQRNLDAKRRENLLLTRQTCCSRSLGSISYFAVLLGHVFILSSTASRIQHHVYRFAFLLLRWCQ